MNLSGDNGHACAPSRYDRLGVVIGLAFSLAIFVMPFALVRPNRVAATVSVPVWQASDTLSVLVLGVTLLCAAAVVIFRTSPGLRLICLTAALVMLALFMGWSAGHLTPDNNSFARVSPGGGFWLLLSGLGLAIGDTLVRLRLGPIARLVVLGLLLLFAAGCLYSGIWRDISIVKEYANRRSGFAGALSTHATLALGSLAGAFVIAFPLGLLVHRFKGLQNSSLALLNGIQTIPSMALFGVLIAPLAWVAATLPGAAALGIAGIGAAPAFIALVAYALLPIVSTTLTGLSSVSDDVVDAARGVGMTRRQRLVQIELPLAFPVILTGIRIVLVQNIGLATIAGLVGGGGLGMFVFQGIAQTAPDLVLLGAVPTVIMAFVAAIVLDALIEISRHQVS
jgi:osmoprotectant transport system permease protein